MKIIRLLIIGTALLLVLNCCKNNSSNIDTLVCIDSSSADGMFNKFCTISNKNGKLLGYYSVLDSVANGPYKTIHNSGIIEKGTYMLGYKYGKIDYNDSLGNRIKIEVFNIVNGKSQLQRYAEFKDNEPDFTKSYFANLSFPDTIYLTDSLTIKVDLFIPTNDSLIELEIGEFSYKRDYFIPYQSKDIKNYDKFKFKVAPKEIGVNLFHFNIKYDNKRKNMYFEHRYFVKESPR